VGEGVSDPSKREKKNNEGKEKKPHTVPGRAWKRWREREEETRAPPRAKRKTQPSHMEMLNSRADEKEKEGLCAEKKGHTFLKAYGSHQIVEEGSL